MLMKMAGFGNTETAIATVAFVHMLIVRDSCQEEEDGREDVCPAHHACHGFRVNGVEGEEEPGDNEGGIGGSVFAKQHRAFPSRLFGVRRRRRIAIMAWNSVFVLDTVVVVIVVDDVVVVEARMSLPTAGA